jgi:NAD(P)-dependent dehydrogenase (short-subunit alcohol dehydrogenase family)
MGTISSNTRPQDRVDLSGEQEYLAGEPKPPFPVQKISPPGIEAQMEPAPRFEAPYYKVAGKLAGKSALITGGDSGIGRAVAVLFAREGADVTFTYLNEEQIDADGTIEAIEAAGCKAYALPGDIRDANFCLEAVRLAVQQFGQLDIIVNNAAFQNHVDDLEDLTLEQWEATFDINVHGPIRMIKAARPYLRRGAVILNTGSITGTKGNGSLIDYAASKAALHNMTKSLADNLSQHGIRVNAVAPGPVWTPLNPAERDDEEVTHFGETAPKGRPAQPEEIAPTFVYLASSGDSSYVSGEIIHITGG